MNLEFREYWVENRDAIDLLEDRPLYGEGRRELSRNERLQVIDLLHRLNARCPQCDKPVAQWKCEVAKLRIVSGRKSVDRRTIQRWTKLAVECGLVGIVVRSREQGGSEWNLYTVDWQAIRGGSTGATRCDTVRHGAAPNSPGARHDVAPGCDTVSHPTPSYVPTSSNTPSSADVISTDRDGTDGQEEETEEFLKRVKAKEWQLLESDLRDRLHIDYADGLCRQLRERGVPPAMIVERTAKRSPDGSQGRLVKALQRIDAEQIRTWRTRQQERARPREAPPPIAAANATDDVASWREKFRGMAESELAPLLDQLNPIMRKRFAHDGFGDFVVLELKRIHLECTTPAAASGALDSVDRLEAE